MAVLVLTLTILTIMAAIGLLTAMHVKDKPWYGAMGICLLLGPTTVLAFTYVALTLS